jgi:hypothetical protein
MKKTVALVLTGFVVLLLANSQAFGDDKLTYGDDMGEGISFGGEQKKSTINYKYDNSIPNSADLMAEGIVFPETSKEHVHYPGDNSLDSLEHLMSEGICMETLKKSIATR